MTNHVPENETKAAFARRINVARQYVQKLAAQGLPVDDQGRVKVSAALRWIRSNTSTNGDDTAPSLTDAKTRVLVLQAERAELEIEKARGSLIDREQARRAVRAFARLHRDHMLRFAIRYGPAIAAEVGVEPGPLVGQLESAMREALNEAFENPEPYREAAAETAQ